MAKLKIVALLVLALLFLIVVLQNTEQIETRLLFVTVTMPRAALLSLTALFGFVLGLGVALILARGSKNPYNGSWR